MEYSNSQVRRQDRLLPESEAKTLLQTGEYGVLSMQREDGGGYGIPISYVWDGHQTIYLHGALEGQKQRAIERCNKVSFCVVGKTRVLSKQFSTEYESIVLDCDASTALSPEERMKALLLLVDKYSPDHKASGAGYAEKLFERTLVIRLDIKQWSGKCKTLPR